MKPYIFVVPMLGLFISTSASAGVIGSAEDFTTLSNTYYSGGEKSIVHGNVISKTYGSTGAGSTINGDFRSGDVLTLGDGATVNGNAESKGAGNAGANTLVTGNLVTGGVGTMGDSAEVNGDFISGLAGTIGANAIIDGSWQVGASSVATASGSSNKTSSDAIDTNITYLDLVKDSIDSDIMAATNDLIAAKSALSSMQSTEALGATFTIDDTLFAGVYDAASWSTTAGTTLTLDGQGLDNADWLFNIDDVLAFGANTTVKLSNVGTNAQVFWNVGSVASPGGYASLGDGADVIGIIIADSYVMVGANATVYGASPDNGNYGGVYSTTSYVSTGANAVIGGQSYPPTAVPEPSTYALMGSMLVAAGSLRRRKRLKECEVE